jgi:hypothetical protein
MGASWVMEVLLGMLKRVGIILLLFGMVVFCIGFLVTGIIIAGWGHTWAALVIGILLVLFSGGGLLHIPSWARKELCPFWKASEIQCTGQQETTSENQTEALD